MALIQNTNYLRINKEVVKQLLEQVRFHRYKDQETRIQGLSEFDLAPEETIQVELTQEFIDSVVTELYIKMKDKIEGAQDA